MQRIETLRTNNALDKVFAQETAGIPFDFAQTTPQGRRALSEIRKLQDIQAGLQNSIGLDNQFSATVGNKVIIESQTTPTTQNVGGVPCVMPACPAPGGGI